MKERNTHQSIDNYTCTTICYSSRTVHIKTIDKEN